MAKLPFMMWFPADWIKDTRHLSLEAKGAWIDLLNFMWLSEDTRGYWMGSKDSLARLIGTSPNNIPGILDELETVAEVAGRAPNCTDNTPGCPTHCPHDVVICSRRISKDEARREIDRIKKQRQRKSPAVPKVSPPLSRQSPPVDVHIVRRSEAINTKKTSTPSAPKISAADPAVGRLNKLFYELLELKVGKGARHNFAQSGQEFKRLLRGNPENVIASTIKNFFESTDAFITNKAYSWGAYVTHYNALKSTGGPIHVRTNQAGGSGKDNRPAGQYVADPDTAKQYNTKVER